MARVFNFNAGPAALPLPALERAQAELLDFEGTGMSILEHSHREPPYERVHREALALVRELLDVPDTHEVLLMQGGARAQFALVPMNLLPTGRSADYVVTGTWAKQALEEAKLVGTARAAADTEVDGKFARVPAPDELALDPQAAYVHLTSNNTLFGTQWRAFPETGQVPLVADMTSDLFTRRLDVSKFGLIFAGAQKNFGPAGVTVVIVRKDLIASARKDVPTIFRYASFAKSESLFNTPPTFPIYVMRNTLRVLADRGGVAAIEAETRAKAERIYGVVDAASDFFRAPVEVDSRSLVNVVFRLPTEALEKQFLGEAKEAALVGLKGHRSVGGVRASLYAAVGPDAVEALATFMTRFAQTHR